MSDRRRRVRSPAAKEKDKVRQLAWYHAQTPDKKRDNWLRKAYGITLVDYEHLVDEQAGCCALCRQEPDTLHVDHAHATGKVRGLLCGSCNRALGLFHENPVALQNALDYLKRHQ